MPRVACARGLRICRELRVGDPRHTAAYDSQGRAALRSTLRSFQPASRWRFGFEIVWRGLVYGGVDALTLFVFPAAVAYRLVRRDPWRSRLRTGRRGWL